MKSTKKLFYVALIVGILYFISSKQSMSEAFGNISRPAVPAGLYGPSGSMKPSGLPQYYETPAGSPLFYGKQEGLLNQLNNPTQIHHMPQHTGPSPYQYPMLNYGVGPQAANVTDTVLNTPEGVFMKDPVLRTPTANNPFMNVMPLDYGAPPIFDNYNRYEKVNYPTPDSQHIREEVESEFERGLYQNANGRLWDRTNSQRQFVSQPVGSVPNDQGEFANWLYGTPGNCKHSSIWDRYGVQYTDESLLCNGFNVATPTNKGLLNENLMSSVAKSPGMYQ